MSTWGIEAIPLYDFVVPGPEVLFQRGFGETVAMTIYAFVLFGADKCVLVDTGLPADIAALNADIRTRKGPEAGFEPRGRPLAEELARRAIVPDAIVVTSFGPYAVGGLSALALRLHGPGIVAGAAGDAVLRAHGVAHFVR